MFKEVNLGNTEQNISYNPGQKIYDIDWLGILCISDNVLLWDQKVDPSVLTY